MGGKRGREEKCMDYAPSSAFVDSTPSEAGPKAKEEAEQKANEEAKEEAEQKASCHWSANP